MFLKTGSYDVNSGVISDNTSKKDTIWTICKEETEGKIYTYDEAVDLIGTGWYTRCLLATLGLSLLGMAIDLFGISVIVTGSACEFNLHHSQKSILLSVPFIGPIIACYFWGYLADTRGRRWTLLVGQWGSFIASIISAFSTNWYMLATLKVIGTSFSSAAQAIVFTYLGESIPERYKGIYMQILLPALIIFIVCYDVPAYYILNLDFQYDWGFITFSPWRLLTLVLSAPLGISALMLHFFFESPKFLIGAGKEKLALEYLRTISRKNGNIDKYPVTKVVLNEENENKYKDALSTSLLDHIVPLFKPPLLRRTLHLFYLTCVMYAVPNSICMWWPVILEAFTIGLKSGDGRSSGSLCDVIGKSKNSTDDNGLAICISTIESRTLLSGMAQGLVFSIIALCISKFGHRRKLFINIFFFIPMMCSLAVIYTTNNVASLVLYVGTTMGCLSNAYLFGYYVDLFPTSYRGMAGCLGAMISRVSSLAGVHFVGAFVMSNCTVTFYGIAIYLLSGIIVAYFLPPDRYN